jgi:hypothetical protein
LANIFTSVFKFKLAAIMVCRKDKTFSKRILTPEEKLVHPLRVHKLTERWESCDHLTLMLIPLIFTYVFRAIRSDCLDTSLFKKLEKKVIWWNRDTLRAKCSKISRLRQLSLDSIVLLGSIAFKTHNYSKCIPFLIYSWLIVVVFFLAHQFSIDYELLDILVNDLLDLFLNQLNLGWIFFHFRPYVTFLVSLIFRNDHLATHK